MLAGPLGAGKTVMVQGMAQGLGISRSVSSPSFVLEKIYQGSLILHHFDFYRLNREEVIESGLLLDLDPRSVAVIEWAAVSYTHLDVYKRQVIQGIHGLDHEVGALQERIGIQADHKGSLHI